MARTIPHRELRNNSSKILEEVRRGETIHITNHGEVVATLIPPHADPAQVTYRSARRVADWANLEIVPAPGGIASEDIFTDLRNER